MHSDFTLIGNVYMSHFRQRGPTIYTCFMTVNWLAVLQWVYIMNKWVYRFPSGGLIHHEC